jgi:4-diphosphocytidyl-2-C-methyl-D-erythritol kinase
MPARTAYAKLNLALHVRHRRADGYHELETLFAFCEDGDRLSVAAADRLSLDVTGPFAGGIAGPDNLVLRAAEAIRPEGAGAAIVLDKRLPIAAGLGGGSADAAAALILLRDLWRTGHDDAAIEGIALGLGADVPACLRSVLCRGEGIGERLTPIDAGDLAGMPVLLVNPRIPLATGPVFAGWDGQDRGALGRGDPIAIALDGRNDLEPPARALRPEIGDVLAALAGTAPLLARMSGSGATCFALYGQAAARDEAAARISAAQPGWWLLPTWLR